MPSSKPPKIIMSGVRASTLILRGHQHSAHSKHLSSWFCICACKHNSVGPITPRSSGVSAMFPWPHGLPVAPLFLRRQILFESGLLLAKYSPIFIRLCWITLAWQNKAISQTAFPYPIAVGEADRLEGALLQQANINKWRKSISRHWLQGLRPLWCPSWWVSATCWLKVE